ncbi:MAG: hypothetical protein DCC67_00890 [Planctomycetota bacterium]|nr:MAG: hypothetical protein DCC67_00890 [Planctomycetota bacterium]
MHPESQYDEPPLAAELQHEVRGLLARLCDGLAEQQDVRRLGDLIAADVAVRRYYLRYLALHSSLEAAAGSFADSATPEASILPFPAPSELGVAGAPHAEGGVLSAAATRRWPWAAAAAVLAAVGVSLWALSRPEALPPPVTPALVASGANRQVAPPLVAQVTFASPDVRWQNANDSLALTARVRPGQTLALDAGAVELTYQTGTTLRLRGPSRFIIATNGGTLQRGEIVARVTKAGQGFTIETPHGKIVDRGTEFGVVVDDFGVSEVNVIEGRVEAFPVGFAGPLADRIGLTTGRTLQWSGDAILSMNAGGRSTPPGPGGLTEIGHTAAGRLIKEVRYDASSRDEGQWTALGSGRAADGSLLLDAAASDARPYLLTTDQFDPSQGPVTIRCDVRLSELASEASPAFSILTRAESTRSKPGATWHDMLARCLRCTLKADAASSEGMLEVGAKYEHDREPSAISWRGFARPQPDVTYRLEMHDDGLNVSFTATLAENPSVTKTVTCRSLFRGVHNFVAFEALGARAVIENVLIRQHRLHKKGVSDALPDLAGSKPRHGPGEPADDGVLASLAPRRATLVLADDFDRPALDGALWQTLGEVSVGGGRLRLGAENPQRHIDTWKPRPYLLTARTFHPASRPVTIVGRASFADNFLHGYGGSFAVLTRAEARYGVGPSWEQSALRRGVRANFWPAASGQNRSLELFEMLSPEPINLLATGDFPINPDARTYFFCITDDGAEATLVFVDAAAPEIRQTLSHATESPLLTSGHIAFESCWGAPVELDSIRIYEGPGGDDSPAAAPND